MYRFENVTVNKLDQHIMNMLGRVGDKPANEPLVSAKSSGQVADDIPSDLWPRCSELFMCMDLSDKDTATIISLARMQRMDDDRLFERMKGDLQVFRRYNIGSYNVRQIVKKNSRVFNYSPEYLGSRLRILDDHGLANFEIADLFSSNRFLSQSDFWTEEMLNALERAGYNSWGAVDYILSHKSSDEWEPDLVQ